MRIVHTESSCAWGGQEIRVLSEMAGMAARGHELTLVCPPQARICAEARRRGLSVEAVPVASKRFEGFLAMHRILKRLQPEVVVTHSSTDSWLVSVATRFWGIAPPIVRTRHISAPVPRNAASRWLYGQAAARVVTTGERLREALIRDLNLAPEHVVSVPTGIDLTRYAPLDRGEARRRCGLPATATIIGIVATLRSWKGHRYLFDAFSRLERPDTWLVVVGDGPGRENLHTYARELGIAERLTMPGNQDDVTPWLAALDLFVLPSYANEGVPQAIMQAMACGLPVVTTPVGSIPEIVSHEATGLLVPPRDADALKDAIARLIDDPALRGRLATAALAQARERFSDQRMLERMDAICHAAAAHS